MKNLTKLTALTLTAALALTACTAAPRQEPEDRYPLKNTGVVQVTVSPKRGRKPLTAAP